ncbi:Transposase, MuDR, plant [Sesbania bispinosa]|nr:Transposase, MuDR, plant [Sesbania bispinosa]
MANTRGGPSISRFDRGSNEHVFYYIDEAPPIDYEVLSSQVDDPSPKDVPNAICMKADGVNLIEVPIEVQAIGGEELDDPDYVEDDENDIEESEDFIDTSEDEGDDIYDTLKDPMLLTQVNSWMYKNSTTDRSSISHARLCENANSIEKFSDYDDSDELVSLNGSDNSDDDTTLKWPEFNEKTDLHENIELMKGMKFDSNVSFRKALMEWTFKRGYDIKYNHNDKSRVTAICKDSCGWRIHASPTQDNSCFQIKSFNPIHQCGRHYENKRVTAKWVAGKYLENFRDSPNWEATSLKYAIQRDHKGLVEVFKEIMPSADHIFCVRHMHNNFNNVGFKGKTFKDLMWNAARAYRESEHNYYMNKIKEIDVHAYEWLKKFEPKLWCRYAHNPELKCNMLLNNIAETFNAYIKEARDKPIITMLEMIRRQLMKRFHVKRDGMLTRGHSICPRILEKLEMSKKDAMNCLVHVGGHRTFEVSHCSEGNKEDQKIMWMKFSQKETFLKAYDWHIHPMPGEEDWPECNYDEILPPNVKIAPGRPKKKRFREEGEPSNAYKISKKGTKIKCGNCNMEGHNAKTCKMPLNPNRKVYRKKKV